MVLIGQNTVAKNHKVLVDIFVNDGFLPLFRFMFTNWHQWLSSGIGGCLLVTGCAELSYSDGGRTMQSRSEICLTRFLVK